MSNFFSRLNYSFGNEDWRSEQEALKIESGDKVLCITASGDRPLNLLLNQCKIVSIDANPIQNYLLNLKCAALHELDYKEYIAFLGVVPNRYRLNTFKKLLPHLSEPSQKYWIEHQKSIEKGVIYQGLLEKRCQSILAPLIQVFRRKKIKQLFEFTSIEEQRDFVQKLWDKFYWRKAFDLSFNSMVSRLLLSYILDDPGIYNHLNGSVKIGTYFYKRMNDGLMGNLARESLLFSLIFKGKVDQEAYPPYLKEEGTHIIRQRTHCIKVKDINLLTFLDTEPSNSYDCFSLSDVASYLNQKDFLKMLKGVERIAKPGARFSIRQFLSNHQFSEDMRNVFHRDTILEKKLEREDRCFIYRFNVGTIRK